MSMRERIRSFRSLLELEPPSLPTPARQLEAALNVDDLERLAKRRTPRFVYDFVTGGAHGEFTLRWNRVAYERRAFMPNVLAGVAQASTATTLMGADHRLPVGIAPIGLTGLARAEGEIGGVRAADSRNVPFTLSTMGTRSIEQVAGAAPGARRWFQLYVRRDRDASRDLVRRAGAAGFDTLVLTADTAVPGHRLRDTRNGLSMPPKLSLRTMRSVAAHPRWGLDFLSRDAPAMANFAEADGSVTELVGSMFDPSIDLDVLEWVREHWPGTLIVKGVLSPANAAAVVECGADGVWLSNHGGRQLDRAVAPLDVLPLVREALGDDVTILIDSGIRSGADVAVALAAGADFTFIGRSYLYALMAGAQRGVERALDLMQAELLNVMQLLGVERVDQLRPTHLTDMSHPATSPQPRKEPV